MPGKLLPNFVRQQTLKGFVIHEQPISRDMENQVKHFCKQIESDNRLGLYHLVLYKSLLIHYERQGFKNGFFISRRRLMNGCRIQSTKTYHKYMRGLVAFGYIEYMPTYHPLKGTEIRLVNQRPFLYE